MEILPGIEIVDLALYLKEYDTLIIADTHVGFEEALNKQGFLLPRFHFKDTMQRLGKIFKKVKPETIIINGDIKHEMGKISEQEWRNTLQLIDFLKTKCKRLVLIKGNHDKVLDPITKKRKIETVDQVKLGDILVTHGDKVMDDFSRVKTIIIGHEHPAVGVKESIRTEIFKCFLKGKFQKKNLIVQPSFNLVTEGTDVTKSRTLSPFLRQDISNFYAYIVADEVYEPVKLKKF